MERRTLLKGMALGLSSIYLSKSYAGTLLNVPYAAGPFKPNWNSLANYQVPEWFRDAKFGMWAHWGPQCQPEYGDWYAREMYMEGGHKYKYHVQKYGHPSKFGFKDVINEWKAEKWDPEELVGLYKKAGAKYFMALANHHDNFDLYDSTHQKWNSTRIGPKKDIIGSWAKAAKNNNLRFGVSVHAAHAWSWMETAQRADKTGPYADIPYDGKLTKADGAGKWWNGEDPQELYAQNHPLSKNSQDNGMIHRQWAWGNEVSVPSKAYCDKFYKRTIELLDKYEPDAIYFDDTILPLWPISDAGLRIAAHMYNSSIKRHGKLEAVLFGKVLDENQRKCLVWDIERGQSNTIEPIPFQTDTCIGDWHYDRQIYDRNGYKDAKTVIHMLVDIVSKNGNLMLNIPVRGNGTIDEKERAVVEDIASWMQVNSESIYGTRPWTVHGEGPALESAAPLNTQGFNEGTGKPFGPADIRFNKKGNILYATMLAWPDNNTALIKKLAMNQGSRVEKVSLLGYPSEVKFDQTTDGLKIQLPGTPPGRFAYVFKIHGAIA
ncbi:alpha-L-fucosidase [Mucilaginibacter sp. MD40]|uniref:alpha-L-fucosidase n=1 Tax=Mucilaginibacter sp. MD40 TaxID=2029590 RepID=UPI000BACDD1B|nr:alpha-L-fucosidase [Mucilaginibacter sp. MD40]PAW94449.1 alpha-L-fucosidase [Mucilaginibacter sp. MD40]